MAKWTLSYAGGQIGKDNLFYDNLNLSWLPSNILAVQSLDGVVCEIEEGDRATETNTGNQENVQTNTLTWWSNLEATWQAAHNAEQDRIAALQASFNSEV